MKGGEKKLLARGDFERPCEVTRASIKAMLTTSCIENLTHPSRLTDILMLLHPVH